MQYAVELYFDRQTEEKLMHLSARAAQEGISTKFLAWKTRPHLTLACLNDVDEARCTQRIAAFAASHSALPAYLGSVGMFPDTKTIFASPIMTASMYQFQRELHAQLGDFDMRGWQWYQPERWVPHCTLVLAGEEGEEAFLQASQLILREFRKMSGKFCEIGLVKVTLPVEEICTFSFA